MNAMYLHRKIDDFLKAWKKNKNRLPLIVRGAMQVGKTTSVLRFAKANYSNVIYIDFASDKYRHILSNGFDVDSIVKAITFINPEFCFQPSNTILVFDNVQYCPDILTRLKSFKFDGRYDVVCIGTIYSSCYAAISSISVGYKQDVILHSLDFEEFLWSKGYSKTIACDLLNHLVSIKPLTNDLLLVFNQLSYEFCLLGGRPSAVVAFLKTNSINTAIDLQIKILQAFENECFKFSGTIDPKKLVSVYSSVPIQLSKTNKKFQYRVLNKNARARDYQTSVDWLVSSLMFCKSESLQYLELPLKGNTDPSKFKLYYSDTSLLMSSFDEESKTRFRVNRDFSIKNGALVENIVAEALFKQNLNLYYFKKENSSLNVDFLLRTQNELVPVDVKVVNKNSKVLSTLVGLNSGYTDIKRAIKIGSSNIDFKNNIHYIPLFCSFLIKDYLATLK